MRIIVGFEESATLRDSFRALGHDAWSCDIQPTRGDPQWHYQCDIFDLLARDCEWDLGVFHPVCKFPANSGAKHLYHGMKKENGIHPGRWAGLVAAAGTFKALLGLPFPYVIENPVWHCHAKKLVGVEPTQIVQPWWFGDPYFKAICLWMNGVMPLRPTNKLTPPKPGTDEHKRWSAVHREPPGPDRAKNRSKTFPGFAMALAEQIAGDIREQAA